MKTKSNITDKLDSIAKQSKWIEESNFRLENKERLRYSQKIAVIVLRELRKKGIKQKDLAEMLNVSPQTVNKWLKGSENFTLDTIIKLNKALKISIFPQLENSDQNNQEEGKTTEIKPVKTEPKVIKLVYEKDSWSSEELLEN